MVRGIGTDGDCHSVAAQGVLAIHREKERDTLAATITGGKVQQASNVITGCRQSRIRVDATFGGTNNPLTDARWRVNRAIRREVPAMSTLMFWKRIRLQSTFGEHAQEPAGLAGQKDHVAGRLPKIL